MPSYLTPGVYVEEVSTGTKPIGMVGTSTAAFVGVAPDSNARLNEAVACNNWSEFVKRFVGDGDPGTDLARHLQIQAQELPFRGQCPHRLGPWRTPLQPLEDPACGIVSDHYRDPVVCIDRRTCRLGTCHD